MRIVSLLPSATEILFALGFDLEIVGVSHECDFPPRARTKPVVIHSRLPHDASPAEIDALVREYVHRGESLYAVDTDVLETLAPDLIITQDLCHVCAASPDDLAAALARFDRRPQVLCLNPQDLSDVWRDILWVGEETCHGPQAEALLEQIGSRLGALEQQLDTSVRRPRVAFLEWLQPFYVGGHWVPEMIHRAGGEDVFGKARTPSFRVALQDVVEAAPQILLIAPCGYTAERARSEYRTMDLPDQWGAIPAVQNGRVYALEANSYFSRPGPRLITGVEALSKLFQPAIEISREAEAAVLPIATDTRSARAASV
ncbi:MAG TPA: cobalamin-binding protein [Candidatus Acidoferrum sp.]|jgi:iron complex transport system substrate-binding protein|nr:cobalamin-binding protein [Candidatus Acidoferrum sp.]